MEDKQKELMANIAMKLAEFDNLDTNLRPNNPKEMLLIKEICAGYTNKAGELITLLADSGLGWQEWRSIKDDIPESDEHIYAIGFQENYLKFIPIQKVIK